jgi:hypothetical protein
MALTGLERSFGRLSAFGNRHATASKTGLDFFSPDRIGVKRISLLDQDFPQPAALTAVGRRRKGPRNVRPGDD